MTELVYAIGDFLRSTFTILEIAENGPNYAFVALGLVGIIYWIMRQKKYTEEDRKAGRLI